jgi:hypothetical protein
MGLEKIVKDFDLFGIETHPIPPNPYGLRAKRTSPKGEKKGRAGEGGREGGELESLHCLQESFFFFSLPAGLSVFFPLGHSKRGRCIEESQHACPHCVCRCTVHIL